MKYITSVSTYLQVINSNSIKTRFIFSFIGNIVRIVFSFFTGLLIARSLEPSGYGDYNFLLTSFSSLSTFLDLGTSSAFYTFISQKKRDQKFYIFYFLWLLIQFIFTVLLIQILVPEDVFSDIWLGKSKSLVLLAFIANFMMNKAWQTASYIGESIRETVLIQIYNTFLVSIYFLIVAILYYLNIVSIEIFLSSIALIYAVFSVILTRRLIKKAVNNKSEEYKNIFSEFAIYCLPLVSLGFFGFIHNFADNWLLQHFGGSDQQGYYSIGYRFSTIILIATTSILHVFWKEIADAIEKIDLKRLEYLYTTFIPILYFVSAVGACFMIFYSKDIIQIFLGDKYLDGWLSLSIMMIYPVHQTIGQLNSTFYFASNKTMLYSKITIIVQLVSIVFGYIMLADNSYVIHGLDLGSVGLSIKMVIVQIVSVNVMSYFICKIYNWKFEIAFQIKTIVILISVTIITYYVTNITIGGILSNGIIRFGLNGLIYIVTVCAILIKYPNWFGINNKYIENIITLVKMKLS